MVVVTQTATLSSLHAKISPPPPLLYLRHLYKIPTKPTTGKRRSVKNPNGAVLSVRAYMEDSNTLSGFANKVIGSLPVVGLIARIFSDEGGLGGDTIDFAEFRRRVGNKCSVNDSRAFMEFKDRRGRNRKRKRKVFSSLLIFSLVYGSARLILRLCTLYTCGNKISKPKLRQLRLLRGNEEGITKSKSKAVPLVKQLRGDSLYVLLCCWLAAVGAGLLKSEEILEGVARLRLSNDIEFEEETFLSMMNEAKEKRAKLNVQTPVVPMEARAEKALEAIYVCCFGRDPMEEEDERLLCIMLNAVFPSVGQPEINRIVKDKATKVAEGGEDERAPEPKPLSEEAVQLQMKELQFLKQNSST
ncbi:hypothetical protein RHMOL_Rhmol08G0065500 [Rhododendron molle]|uniref:Uncharacterized protein n=1 Tax=Rhododendron molle TaxID=49168 RepID=A0ACC0MKI9_RHOML|nr:hypothetical protein RHMOL_Rhmol08G0065500 [Rhododendron molle]